MGVYFIGDYLKWSIHVVKFRLEDYTIKKSIGSKIICVLIVLAVTLGFLLFGAARWYIDVYGDVGFDAISFGKIVSFACTVRLLPAPFRRKHPVCLPEALCKI